MARLFILIKKKGQKRFIGAIPARKGVSVERLRKTVPRGLRKGFSFRIVTEMQLKKVVQAQRPRVRRKAVGRKRRFIRRKKKK